MHMIMGLCGEELSLYVQFCLIFFYFLCFVNNFRDAWFDYGWRMDGENTPRTKAAKTYGGIVVLCLSLAVP